MSTHQAEVFVQIDGEDVHVGHLYSHQRRGAESATFRYDDSWLADARAYPLDPALGLFSGPIQTPDGRSLFGAFSDCAPDRWGRRLIERQERRRAEAGGQTPRSFGDFDFLMHVRDDGRQGALRLRYAGADEWAAGAKGFPHLVDLPRLLSASQNLQRDIDTPEDVSLLVRAGSSLGGARPKAHLLKEDGTLAIAKFPSTTDENRSVVQWEYVALVLAGNSGITTPDSRLLDVEGVRSPVLLVDRFDRQATQRIGYISAMTALESTDGDQRTYLEIAQFLEPESPSAQRDLHEFWRRLIFGILISNTDDHLRNHGFLRRGNGWQLAPAFDLNPDHDPSPKSFATRIDTESGDRNSIADALRLAPYFRLNEPDARSIIGEVVEGVAPWREVARRSGIGDTEIESMTHAFEHDELRAARAAAGPARTPGSA